MAKKKRRNFEVFSLSFLDCICCGFGAMLLLFVLTVGKSAENKESVVSNILAMISQLETDISKEQELVGNIRYRLKIQDERLASLSATKKTRDKNITELKDELALLLLEQSNLQDELDKLLDDKEAIPTQEEAVPIPIPNVQRRQYLSGFNFEGDNIVFLVEATGSMLGYTVDEAIENNGSMTDEEKRGFEKWVRVTNSVQWILANLTPRQRYHIMVFSTDATAIIPERGLEWFDPLDRETMQEVLKELREVTPNGGANLERAFTTVLGQFPGVDTIMLLADGLPTQSDSIPMSGSTVDSERERLFQVATRRLPDTVTVNTILFPMSGDPGAAFLFWQMASNTHGALVSPAPSWPDI